MFFYKDTRFSYPYKKTPTFQILFDLNYYLFIYYLSIIIMVATSTYVSLLLRNDVRSDKKEYE